MDIKRNELYKNGVANLSAAMDKIKFNGLTPKDAETIRGHIWEARNSIAILSDFEPDHTGEFSSLLKMADVVEKALDVANDSTTYI